MSWSWKAIRSNSSARARKSLSISPGDDAELPPRRLREPSAARAHDPGQRQDDPVDLQPRPNRTNRRTASDARSAPTRAWCFQRRSKATISKPGSEQLGKRRHALRRNQLCERRRRAGRRFSRCAVLVPFALAVIGRPRLGSLWGGSMQWILGVLHPSHSGCRTVFYRDGGRRIVGRVSGDAGDLVLPVVFPLVMAVGGALGVAGVPLPGVETGSPCPPSRLG